MAGKDYIIRVGVNQDGVDTYLKEMGRLGPAIKKAAVEVDKMNLLLSRSGLHLSANATGMDAAIRRQINQARQAQSKAYRAMTEVSMATQRDVVKRQRKDLKRPGASTGRLEALTGSSRNRTSNRRFFGVGDIGMLTTDKSVRYALAIEAGSKASLGRRLTGYWGGQGGVTGFGAPNPSQRFYLSSASAARAALSEAGARGKVSGIVKRPILAHRAYRKTAFYFRPQEKMAQAIRQAYGFRSS